MNDSDWERSLLTTRKILSIAMVKIVNFFPNFGVFTTIFESFFFSLWPLRMRPKKGSFFLSAPSTSLQATPWSCCRSDKLWRQGHEMLQNDVWWPWHNVFTSEGPFGFRQSVCGFRAQNLQGGFRMCQSSFSTKGKAQGALTLYVPVAAVCSCVKQKKITPKEYLFLVTKTRAISVPQKLFWWIYTVCGL